MKQATFYECEICHTNYSDEDICKKCENNHTPIEKLIITDARYVSIKTDAIDLPVTITLTSRNGRKYTYKR